MSKSLLKAEVWRIKRAYLGKACPGEGRAYVKVLWPQRTWRICGNDSHSARLPAGKEWSEGQWDGRTRQRPSACFPSFEDFFHFKSFPLYFLPFFLKTCSGFLYLEKLSFEAMTLVVLLFLTFLANISNWERGGEGVETSLTVCMLVYHSPLVFLFFPLSTQHLYASLIWNCPLKVTSEFLVKT